MEKVGNMEKEKEHKIIGFPIIQNQQDFIIGKFSISQIFKFTKYTSRILNSFDENGIPIYNEEIQREIETSRANRIADFLIEDPEATFPTNIVLHIPKEGIDEQKEHQNFVELKIKQEVFDKLQKGEVYITVIDGQHRIRGIEIALERIKKEIEILYKTLPNSSDVSQIEEKLSLRIQRLKDLENIELVVSFFIDKTIEYQAMIFSTINRTQKRVSQSLVYDLFGLDLSDTPQKTAIQAIIALNGHKKSPFFNRIKFYGGTYSLDSSPPLSQAAMAKSIVALISESLREAERDRNRKRSELRKRTLGSTKFLPFRRYYANDQDQTISDIIFYFFTAIKEVFTREDGTSYWDFETSSMKPSNILQTTVGYEALINILVEILQRQEFSEFNNANIFIQYLSRCKDIDITNTNIFSFNNRGKKILQLTMSLAIYPPTNISDIRKSELESLISE